MPSQKVGTPSASALQPLSTRSSHEPGASALITATGTPSSNPTRIAAMPSCTVAGMRCTMRPSTGWRLWIDSAEIAVRGAPQPRPVLDHDRPVEAEPARSRPATCSGVAFSPTMRADRAAGHRVDHAQMPIEAIEQHRQHLQRAGAG